MLVLFLVAGCAQLWLFIDLGLGLRFGIYGGKMFYKF